MMHRRYNSYSEYLRENFGGRVQKLTLDAGFTCPNRDGSKSTGGCTFCMNDAFNPSYCQPSKSITQQIEEGISFHARRYRRADRFLAYFQAYSNTYAPPDVLEERYAEALRCPGVIGLVIGTRPDCMPDAVLDLLTQLSHSHHISVEIGIESIYNRTLERVNRGHTFEETVTALEKISSVHLHTGAHIIFGLPGESCPDMLQSIDVLSGLPINSIKFHQLQIFKGTPMEKEYMQFPTDFWMPDMPAYLNFMVDCIERLNPDIAVERIAGETPPRYAVHQPWGPRYDQILGHFEKLLEEKDTWQGKKWLP